MAAPQWWAERRQGIESPVVERFLAAQGLDALPAQPPSERPVDVLAAEEQRALDALLARERQAIDQERRETISDVAAARRRWQMRRRFPRHVA
jgi:hypothetical protein